MKKTKAITLVLITASLASCNQKKKTDWEKNNVFMRSDTTAGYARSNYHGNSPGLWYYAFRPYGYYNGSGYHNGGYYSGAISERANVGYNSTKSNIVRGGFGSSGYSVSS